MLKGSGRSGARGRRVGWAWLARGVAGLAAVAVFAVTGYGWYRYRDFELGIHRSDALTALADTARQAPPGVSTAPAATQNLLVIGLDSRLDENGNPLPPAVYQAMDTGGPDVGGYNANVLMLLHIPGDGSPATAVSIPRDDYVGLPGDPDGV
ncbi:MAG: hypothetical protein JOY78_11560, partial [Pseudonocardia sp.]|nr:hypothetical protein [Pseudonocardia sp.]